MNKKKERKDPSYVREQGKREKNVGKRRNISFSFIKHIESQGQSIKNWGQSNLLEQLYIRMKFVGQFNVIEALQKQYIKEYKVDFPPESEFKKPTHINNVKWSVMHLNNNSKEVVVGYIEDDVFYIVFLDKDHKFWPTKLKNT